MAAPTVSSPSSITRVPPIEAGLQPLWRNDVPGDPFIDGDVVPLRFGRRAFYTAPNPDVIDFVLPEITPGNGGQRVALYDTTFASKDVGTIRFQPAANDSVGGFGDGVQVEIDPGSMLPWMDLESDGDGQWNPVVGNVAGTFDGFVITP